MKAENPFGSLDSLPELLAALRRMGEALGPLRLMEVCGTHTMSIA